MPNRIPVVSVTQLNSPFICCDLWMWCDTRPAIFFWSISARWWYPFVWTSTFKCINLDLNGSYHICRWPLAGNKKKKTDICNKKENDSFFTQKKEWYLFTSLNVIFIDNGSNKTTIKLGTAKYTPIFDRYTISPFLKQNIIFTLIPSIMCYFSSFLYFLGINL